MRLTEERRKQVIKEFTEKRPRLSVLAGYAPEGSFAFWVTHDYIAEEVVTSAHHHGLNVNWIKKNANNIFNDDTMYLTPFGVRIIKEIGLQYLNTRFEIYKSIYEAINVLRLKEIKTDYEQRIYDFILDRIKDPLYIALTKREKPEIAVDKYDFGITTHAELRAARWIFHTLWNEDFDRTVNRFVEVGDKPMQQVYLELKEALEPLKRPFEICNKFAKDAGLFDGKKHSKPAALEDEYNALISLINEDSLKMFSVPVDVPLIEIGVLGIKLNSEEKLRNVLKGKLNGEWIQPLFEVRHNNKIAINDEDGEGHNGGFIGKLKSFFF